VFNVRSRKGDRQKELRVSKDYIGLVPSNFILNLLLAVVPLLSIILIYSRLLQGIQSNVVPILTYSLVLFVCGLLILYIYKFVARKNPASGSGMFLNMLGLIFLALSLLHVIGSVEIASDSKNWATGNLSIIFSLQPFIKIIFGLTFSIIITTSAFLAKYFVWEKQPDSIPDDYSVWSMKLNLWLSIIFVAVQPVLLVIDLATMPVFAMTTRTFGLVFDAFCVLFLVLHLYYNQLKHTRARGASYVFYFVILLFGLTIFIDRSPFDMTSRSQLAALAGEYDKMEADRLAKSAKIKPAISGEEIYQVKCMACHKFDVKFVGPPHKEVLLKYADKKDDMVKFILNPVKVNPDYPPMPNQGLKPEEATAVVEYMFKEWGDKLK